MRQLTIPAALAVAFAAALFGIAPVAAAAAKKCARYVDIGLPDEKRAVDVKPTYRADLFKASIDRLPPYQPQQQVAGTLRVWGSDYVGSKLGEYWRADFGRSQPKVELEYRLVNALTAIPAITLGVGDLAPNRAASWAELFLFERVKNYKPLEVAIATGAWSSSFAIIVHRDNPLTQLTMEQLDGIFGAQRDGGFVGTQWHPENGRGPERNIRTWGQLGLTGEWRDQPIRVHGSILNAFLNRHFERLVFKGGVKWNESYREYETCVTADGKPYYRQDQFADAMSSDKFSIALGYQRFGGRPNLKILKIAPHAGAPAVELTVENLHDRTYPLSQNYYVYLDREPGKPLAPEVKEFMRYILSREGQAAIARHGKYLPLTEAALRIERRKLE